MPWALAVFTFVMVNVSPVSGPMESFVSTSKALSVVFHSTVVRLVGLPSSLATGASLTGVTVMATVSVSVLAPAGARIAVVVRGDHQLRRAVVVLVGPVLEAIQGRVDVTIDPSADRTGSQRRRRDVGLATGVSVPFVADSVTSTVAQPRVRIARLQVPIEEQVIVLVDLNEAWRQNIHRGIVDTADDDPHDLVGAGSGRRWR